jgi:pentatricopeptide repeat protein
LDFKPDTYCGNAVVSAWARAYHRPDSVEQAFMALRRMTRFCTIDLDGYSALLDALQKKGMADKSLKLLETIEGAGARDSRMLPRVNEYNSVLSALARSGRPKQAEELLAKMDTMAARQGRSSTSPDKFSFTIVIDAWARNPDPSSFAGASRVLEEMLTRYRAGDIKVKPDHFTFSVVMKACLRTQSSDEDKQHSLDKALEVFRAIEFGKPDHVGYSAILLVIRKQACDLSLRRSLLASVFEECKAAGMVSQGVVDAVRQSDAFALHSLDAAWSKHVPRKEWP